MARKAYIGVGDAARTIKNAYIGIDGKSRRIKKIYLGVGGTAQLICSTASYTVSFNANGGSGTMNPVATGISFTGTGSVAYALPNNSFARSNYQFIGWKVENSGSLLAPGASITVSSNITVYAQWVELVTITWKKNAEVNWAAATIHTNLTGDTGPVTPDKLVTKLSHPNGYALSATSLNWNDKFRREWNRSTNSIDLGWLGKYTWTTSTVYGDTADRQLQVPKGTKLTFTLNNNYYRGGSHHCGIAVNNAWVKTGSSITYEMTIDKNIRIEATWGTSGEYIPGWEDLINLIPGISATDDRDSWWDVYITY